MDPADLFSGERFEINFDKFIFPEKEDLKSECKNCVFESYGVFGSERIVVNQKELNEIANCSEFGCALLIRVITYNVSSSYNDRDNI